MNLRFFKGVFAFSLALLVGQPFFAHSQEVVDKIVAKVDNYIILKSDLERAYQNYLSQGQYDTPDAKCSVLEQLILNKMMLAKAEIDSVTVSDQEVNKNLDRRMQLIINQVGSEDRIEDYYGKSVEEFKNELHDDIRDQMLVEKMQGQITDGLKVTPSEVRAFYNNIPKDSLPFFSTQLSVAEIVKDPTYSAAAKQKVKNQLLDIRDKILNGASFEEMAKKYSEEPAAKRTGGNLGFFKRGELAPEYEATALSLKPGEISKPVETEFGFHIIQLIERRGNEFNTRHILIKPEYTSADIDRAKNYLDSLRTQIVADSIGFEKAAKEYSDDMQTSSSGGYILANQEGGTTISADELDPVIFFTLDTMKVGQVSKPMVFTKKDGSKSVRILYYKNKIAPHQADFNEDYQKIKDAAMNKKKAEALNKWFDDAQHDVYIYIDDDYKNCNIIGNEQSRR